MAVKVVEHKGGEIPRGIGRQGETIEGSAGGAAEGLGIGLVLQDFRGTHSIISRYSKLV